MPSNRLSPPPATGAPRSSAPSIEAARRLNSAELFRGAGVLVIEHRGAEYRLRQTALGKLILTK